MKKLFKSVIRQAMHYRLHAFLYRLRQLVNFPLMAAVILFIWIQNKQWKVS